MHTALISLATISTRFNVHELLSSCSDMRRSKVNVSLNSVVPSAWLPGYKVPRLRGQKRAR